MELPKKAGLYHVRINRSSPYCREFLDIKAWYNPKSGAWISEDLRQTVGTYLQVTAGFNGVYGWTFWKCQEAGGVLSQMESDGVH